MKTKYEILNVDLAQEYSKARKLEKLKTLSVDSTLEKEIANIVLDGEDFETVMKRAEDDDRLHWITVIAKRAAYDLLTIGKVQPENMASMAVLPHADFVEAVKIATTTARKLNELTIETEKELNTDLLDTHMI